MMSVKPPDTSISRADVFEAKKSFQAMPERGAIIAMAKPGEEIPVLVRPGDDATAQLLLATGTLSNDGKFFSVVVTSEDGSQQTP